ncbi:MerR family transcriptional regulator [Bacillus atrophaeus]|uniref:MerR family transcriptional regulator n=1 Tax=Bacillus atrophaeus TaxID=1452 RepID=UPI00227E3E5B|nr:MerR family transcriptional regulator [Bacillus atrophaeus]MCY8466481.1 MerR family transcriptional regulator [Bacillus atrophaeus]MCY8478940.1 MerR family transcriptional regulator [Bacillus atrophaeus]
MSEQKKDYTMHQAALMLDVHRDTIMYWEEKGLIPSARRNPKNNYRVYNIDDVMKIAEMRGIGAVDEEAVGKQKYKKQRERERKRQLEA